jgi:hypothetical protein
VSVAKNRRGRKSTNLGEELGSDGTGTRVDKELHLADFFVNVRHELSTMRLKKNRTEAEPGSQSRQACA